MASVFMVRNARKKQRRIYVTPPHKPFALFMPRSDNHHPGPQLSPKTPFTNITVSLSACPPAIYNNTTFTCAVVKSRTCVRGNIPSRNAIYPPRLPPKTSAVSISCSTNGVPLSKGCGDTGQLTKRQAKAFFFACSLPRAPPPPAPSPRQTESIANRYELFSQRRYICSK